MLYSGYEGSRKMKEKKKINILMCGSDLNVRGGIISVVKNYLSYERWNDYNICYIPTHIEKNKFVVALYFLQAYFRILFTALRGDFEIAYFHTAERGSFFRKAILVRTLKRLGLKTIMHHHAAEFDEFYESLSEKKKHYVIDTLEKVDLNIVLSNRLIRMITDKAPSARVKVLYNAVPTYEVNPYNANARNILFLGRLGKRKGVYDLLDVIKSLDDKLPQDVRFYLCGDGDIENVRKMVCEYEIQHRIVYIGWVDKEQKNKYIADSMINVLPSYNEGLPMSILETMANGIPNISTNIASIPEVISEGKNGFMITPGDTEALADKILMLVNDNTLRLNMSQQAWSDITTKFSLDAHIAKLKSFFSEI